MAEDLVAASPEARRDIGGRFIDLGVHLGLGGKAQLVEQLEEAPDAHTIAVVAPAVDAVALGLVGRGDGRPLAHAEAEGLDVEGQVDGEATPAGPGVVGPPGDVRVLVASVRGQHGVPPGRRSYSACRRPWADPRGG